MKLNSRVALLHDQVCLVPYSIHHVSTYHEWMQDPDLQAATASEPLSLEEEYAMQRTWRQDHDKLTFIICSQSKDMPSYTTLRAGMVDTERNMVGDINLFLTEAEDEDQHGSIALIGEIELMIARPASRGKGYGKAALLVFLQYISSNLSAILVEYARPNHKHMSVNLAYLRVKINEQNSASLALFRSIGFEQTSEHANYFGELELRLSITKGLPSRIRDFESSREILYEVQYDTEVDT